MWDEVDEETGATREAELRYIYWKAMIDRCSSIGRFEGSRDSAFRLIAPFLDEANNRTTLLIQKELVDHHLRLRETQAGQLIRSEIEQSAKQHQGWLSETWNAHGVTSESLREFNDSCKSLLQQTTKLEGRWGW
jgi:hypothetical protein